MRQFLTIATNAFMELIRQPVFLLLMTVSVLFEIFLAVPYYFAFGDESKLVENETLAVMLLSGLLGAVLSASASLAREIRAGTALAVLSKPVGRAQFFLAKYAGLAAALTVLSYVNLIGVLLASWMSFDAYGKTDLPALGIFAAGRGGGLRAGGLQQFFPAASVCERRGAGAGGVGDIRGVFDFPIHQATTKPLHASIRGLAAGAGGNPDFVRAVDSGGAGAGLFDAAGHHSNPGGLFGVFFDRPDVGLFLRPAGGGRANGGLQRFTPSFQTGNFSGSRTLWTWAKAHSTGAMSARPLPIWSLTRARRWPSATALFEERELN